MVTVRVTFKSLILQWKGCKAEGCNSNICAKKYCYYAILSKDFSFCLKY